MKARFICCVSIVGLICAFNVHPLRAQGRANTLILGDTSGSMKGYSKASANRLSALYQLLYRNTAAPQLAALTSDSNGGGRIAVVDKAAFFSAQGNYRGETDLVFALQHVQKQNGLTVFVTDGMQSGGTYLRVKEEMLKMVGDGWGLWLLALKLPFDGIYDPEQTIDLDVMGPSIQECARQNDNRAIVTFKKGSNRFYNYAGLKPLLFFILSKDVTAGRDLVQRLDFNLKADPQYSVNIAELAPLFYRGLNFAATQPVSDFVHIDEGPSGVIIRSDPVDEVRLKEVIVPVVWQAREPLVPQPFKESPSFAPPETVAWVEEEPQAVADESDPEGKQTPGRFKVRFVSEVPWYRKLCFLPFISCEDAKSDALNLQVWTEFQESPDPWWAALNVDNSYQCPNRVYKLTELARDLALAAKERIKPEERKIVKSLKLVVGPL